MPRGVYARKSEPERKSAPKPAPKKSKAQPDANVKKEQKPTVAPPKKDRTTAPVKPSHLVAPAFLVPPAFGRAKSVAVESIGGDELKAYARSIGITQRDVDGLSEARLRQNCIARIHQSQED